MRNWKGKQRWSMLVVAAGCALWLAACAAPPATTGNEGGAVSAALASADRFEIVDCLLPGKIRRLGAAAVYQTARRAIKTSASACSIRGGEYTAYDRADYRSALNVWLPAAEQGDAAAQTNVGEIFEKGLGTQPDHAAAAQWYRRAAEQNYSRAQINLGYLYEKGLGVAADPVQALNWYRRASGLSGDEIAFASTYTASAAAAEQEQTALRTELARTQQEAAGLRSELDARRAELTRARAEANRLREELKRSQQPDSGADAGRVRELEQALARQQAEVLNRAQALELAQAPSSTTPAGPAAATKAATKQPGPTIEVLDPPIVVLRGTPVVNLRAAGDTRELVGKVTAPAGLLSFTVNDRPEAPDDTGLFRSEVKVEATDTPVRLVAVDRQGLRATLEFTLVPKTRKAASALAAATPRPADSAQQTAARIDFGRYHALIVGNNRYARLPALDTAINDADRADRILRERYGYQTTVLRNATRYDILSALNQLREKLTENDNLLIYYAGHGELDPVNQRGYWLPVDADPDNNANWISNQDVTDILNAMSAKQVFVVADSCYSGAMTRGSLARLEAGMADDTRRRWLTTMARTRARIVFTSGGLAPVLDSGGGQHSIFAKALFDALESNAGVLESYKLYRAVSERVRTAAARFDIEQVPEYAPIRHAGHEAGEFFFVPGGAL